MLRFLDYNAAFQSGVISDERQPPNPVDDAGCFTNEVTDFEGQYVKTADKAIIKHLKGQGRLIVDSQITHSYVSPISDGVLGIFAC